MNGYDLSRAFVDWSFENPEKIRPVHYAVFFFAVEHCNRLGWKKAFGLPTYMVMEAIGVKKHATYSDALKDLEEWGFITFVERSKNQHTANIVTLNAMPKNGKAKEEALAEATAKQREKQPRGTVTIDKQLNNETIKQERPTFQEWSSCWEEKGKNPDTGDCLAAFEYWESENWMRKGEPIKSWKLAMVNNPAFKKCPNASIDLDSETCLANPPKDWMDQQMAKCNWTRKEAKEKWRKYRTFRYDYYTPDKMISGL